MKRIFVPIALAVAGFAGAAGYGLYHLGLRQGMTVAGSRAEGSVPATASDPSTWTVTQGEAATRRHLAQGLKAGDIDPQTGRRILYYHDPMVPGNRFEQPGKSPFMDMMLVPVYAGAGAADTVEVTVSARMQQNLGLRTAPVEEGTLTPRVDVVGNIAFNERDQAIVQARATGFVERVHVRATLDRVGRGQPLADLYVPDWIAAQEEFLSVQRMRGSELGALVDAARQRMRQAGMSDELIRLVESTGRTQPRATLVAPIGGVAVEVAVREGMTVASGTTLFRINGLSTVWANAEVPESQSAQLRTGGRVRATSPAAPGVTFEGRIQAILPDVNETTRTRKARVELANPGGRLAPGMFVSMQLADVPAAKALLVPSDAVIRTGVRKVVFVAGEGGHFRPVEVETGLESGDRTEIRRGLEAGQQVVVSAQFLLDSEASLRGLEARLDTSATTTVPATHRATALIESVESDGVMLTHPPIASLQWPEMTMKFRLPPGPRPSWLKPGERVDIEFQVRQNDVPQIMSLQRAEPAPRSTR